MKLAKPTKKFIVFLVKLFYRQKTFFCREQGKNIFREENFNKPLPKYMVEKN
jgi:hypothetical protein